MAKHERRGGAVGVPTSNSGARVVAAPPAGESGTIARHRARLDERKRRKRVGPPASESKYAHLIQR